jgi:hypothetical protein
MGGTIVAIALAIAIGQTAASQAPGQTYAGTWIAELTGTTYIRLELEGAAGALRGRISLGNVTGLDAQGQVIKAEPAPRELTTIFDVTLRTTSIAFSHKNGNDTDHFEMRLVGNEAAELLLILSDEDRKDLAADGLPAPKPFRLKKVAR